MTTHLIIPDSHSHPDYHNDRFDWLGKLILDIKPDVVINIGDMADMPSLSSYDKGTKGYEGKRYKNDIDVVRDADDRLWHPTRKAKKKAPRRVLCLGNHEDRISRAINADPKLDGTLSLADLGYTDNWEVYPFLEPVTIDGVTYAHYFTSGVMGRAVGGEHPAYSLLTKQFSSTVQGHNHLLDYCRRVDSHGHPINGLTVGCYFDYNSPWASSPVNDLYWRGVVILNDVQDGDYDLQVISLSKIREVYN